MKLRRIVVIMAALCLSPFAKAERKYGMAGCGLGSVLLGPHGGQVSAATTNGTSGTQSFGILSGTSNCQPDKFTTGAERHFMIHNFASFEKDVARGYGDTIAAFSAILDCQTAAVSDIGQALQTSYSTIFSNPGIVNVIVESKEQLRSNPGIRTRCSKLI